MSAPLSPPEPLTGDHRVDSFDSGEPVLDDWLKRRARANQASGASRTYVVCKGKQVAGYYALASGAIAQAGVPGKFRRNMPDPIPVVVLARVAVNRNRQRRGLGRSMFRDAAFRVIQAADTIGIRGIVVHAISEDARRFYIALGFDPCAVEATTLMVGLRDLRAALEARS
ncbi:MAG: GNAT family N-acetyltransferase [Bryobacteraceae bacterium]